MSKRTEYIKTVSQAAATLLSSLAHSYWVSEERINEAVSTAHLIVRTAAAKAKDIKFDDDPEQIAGGTR